MGNRFNEIMQKLRAQRVRARRYTAMLLVLAMLTSLSVSWRLHQVGTALTTDSEYYCGMEEHVHTDDCYTEELVCGYEEGEPEEPDSAAAVDPEPPTEAPETEPEEPEPEETEPEVHHHTADCYETVLVEHKELTCGEEEHTHDETCPVDPDTGDFICGYEEHEHSDDCYTTETETEEKLVCGYEEGQVLSDGTAAEDGIAALEDTNTTTSVAEESSSEAVSEPVLHHHTEACYEKVLTCTIPEHTHTLECLADYSADVETDDDWEKYSVGLSDNWNEALLAVAQEQLGYKESEKNFQTDEALGDIIDVHHYTRYGAFYGNPYADWDVAFIAFCQHYAGIPKTEIPQRLGLEALRADMDTMGFAYLTEGEDAAYEAIPGDVVTYYKNGNADDETIGIVETVGDDSLTVISGAVEGAVAEVTVPFTDVTSTILVDQAYDNYVGEADDRDGSYDEEIAVQSADEKDAAAVDASEDIFDTTGALDLNKEENQRLLGLTFTLENKPDGKNWKEIPDGSEIQEGDEVRLVLNMGSVPENTFHDGPNGNKAYYQLPYKLAEPLTDKPIYKEGSKSEVIGHLNVNTEGLAIITFDKVQGFDYTKYFKATIHVKGKIVANGTGTSGDIKFSDDAHFTLKKNSDIKTEKTAAAEVVEKGGKTYFKYTVKVSSENGTAGQPVKIDDVITNLYNLTGSYDKDSFELTKIDETKVDLTDKLTFASNGKSFEIGNLESLDKGEFYELTYLYEVRHSGEYSDKWGVVDNTAKATSGENEWTDTAKKSLSSEDITVEKTGKINGAYSSDKSLGKIAWTVTINNPNGRDLKGYVVNDALKTSGITIRAGDRVKIQEWKESSQKFEDFKVNGEQQYGTINTEKTGFTYTFPEGSTGTKYQFIYYTTMPDGTDGTKDVINGVDVEKGEKEYHAEGTVKDAVRNLLVLKNSSGKLETVSTGKMQEKKWSIAVRTDASVGKKNSFTITDTFQKPTIGGVEATGLKHYAVKSELDTQLKRGIKFYWVSGETSGTAWYSDLTKPTFNGVKINITYYDADGNEVTEDAGEVTSFQITVDWTGTTDDDLVITQLNAEPYSSYVEDVSSLEADKTLTVTNKVECGGKVALKESSYTKPAAGKAELKKYVCDNADHGFSEKATVEYGKIIWFKLILKNVTDDTVTVTDTLPKGLKYENFAAFADTGWKCPYYVGFSKNKESGVNANESLFPLSGRSNTDDASRQGKGYLTVDSTEYEKNQEQTLTFTLKNLKEAQKNNPEGYDIAIIFGVRVDDDRWEDINFTKHTYTNTAKWGKEENAKTADVTVERTNFGLWKTAQQSRDKNAATYTVEINKESKQWLSTPGSELELHDTLTIPAEIDAEINRQNVKLEKYVNGVLEDVTTTDLRSFTLEPMQIDGTNKVYKMTFTVPDGCYYKLTYEYRFLVGGSLGEQQFEISNKVDMFGHGEIKSDYRYHYAEGGGTASQKNTNTLQLLKVERNKYHNILPGATFKLSKRDGGVWSAVREDCTTDANGQILFRYADSVNAGVKVERGVLYKLEETAAPNGYIGDSTPHYFLMLDANQAKEDAAINSVVQNSGVAESQITFVAANQTEQMYVENTAKRITIRKVWQDANGKQETNVSHDDITVKLTRADKTTGQEDTSWSADITLSSGNDWTYIYPDTSKTPTPDAPLDDNYTYAVKEDNVPSGYNVSYTDQNGKETHTGFTSGDTVVIKNMQKSGWLKVEKKWLAEDGKTALKDADLPESITVQLYKVNDSGVGEKVEGKTLKLNAGNYWKGQFTGLEEDAQYYVVEDPQVAGFKVTYSHTDLNAAPTGSTVTVTNTKKRTETTLDVVKKWQDSDGKPLTENLPEITVHLYQRNADGTNTDMKKSLTLKADNNWKGQFTDLDPDTQYYVVEDTVDGYTVSYTSDVETPAVPGATIVVTNRKDAPGYELPATGSTGTAPYTTAGAVLMGAALVGGYRRKRRQERRGE